MDTQTVNEKYQYCSKESLENEAIGLGFNAMDIDAAFKAMSEYDLIIWIVNHSN